MKQITFEFKPIAGSMFLDNEILSISPEDYDKLKNCMDPKYKHGYIIMSGTIISSTTYNYEFTKDDYRKLINYIQTNFLKDNYDDD